ncbi:MAG TPA: hypothetical protein VGI03_07950 [Verrucomicrobiae bacterium]|jgi:hypothetical protein
MGIFVFIFIANLAVCIGVWFLTKKLPIWMRLLVVTFLLAVVITPVGGAGEGGAWIMPLGIMLTFLLYNVIMGVGDYGDLHALFRENFALGLFLEIWGITYLLCIVVVLIRYLIKIGKRPRTTVVK